VVKPNLDDLSTELSKEEVELDALIDKRLKARINHDRVFIEETQEAFDLAVRAYIKNVHERNAAKVQDSMKLEKMLQKTINDNLKRNKLNVEEKF
jgi:hypothetical protein